MHLGLNRVGGDKRQSQGIYIREVRSCRPDRRKDLLTWIMDQLWRRVWYNIVYLDWRFSMPMGQTYMVRKSQFTTLRPANVDWPNITDGNLAYHRVRRESFTVGISRIE
jgi:hypothetical protein